MGSFSLVPTAIVKYLRSLTYEARRFISVPHLSQKLGGQFELHDWWSWPGVYKGENQSPSDQEATREKAAAARDPKSPPGYAPKHGIEDFHASSRSQNGCLAPRFPKCSGIAIRPYFNLLNNIFHARYTARAQRQRAEKTISGNLTIGDTAISTNVILRAHIPGPSQSMRRN